MSRPRFALAALLALGLLGFAACGGDDSGSAATTGSGSSATTATASSDTEAASTSAASTSAPSSGDAVSVESWAGGVCGSVETWLRGINQKGTQLGQDVQGVSDLTKGRDLLVQFMEDAVALTDTMIEGVEAAGAPDIENGDQLATDLVAALQPVKDTFSTAVDKAKALPTDDPEAFSAAATQLGQEITDSQTEFSASFDQLQATYDDPALNTAFDTVPECAQLGAATGG